MTSSGPVLLGRGPYDDAS